jgi:hypothetical protein
MPFAYAADTSLMRLLIARKDMLAEGLGTSPLCRLRKHEGRSRLDDTT